MRGNYIMRFSFLIILAVFIGLPVLAQQVPENASVDPDHIFVPEAVADPMLERIEAIPGSDLKLHIYYVETRDGLYTPVGLMKPEGEGHFPVVLIAHMNGGLGTGFIREWTRYGNWTAEQFVKAGYAVVWMRYRAEVRTPYGDSLQEGRFQGRQIFNRGPFEYEDAISIIKFVKTLPYVDADNVGYLGLSHGGEMLMKIASEYDGLKAGIASEPASLDYLALKPRPTGSPEIPETRMDITAETLADELEATRSRVNMDVAMKRIHAINTPMLVLGRINDNNESVFRLNYELMRDAGKNVKWKTYTHPDHGFIFVRRNRDGVYDPDPVQLRAVEDAIDYMDAYLKP